MKEGIALPNVSAMFGSKTRRVDPDTSVRRAFRRDAKGLPFSTCDECGATWNPDDTDICEDCEG